MIFLGCLYNNNEEKDILNLSKIGLQNAVNTFQLTLIDGLNENLSKPIDIINVLPVGTWPNNYKKIKLESKKWSYHGSNNIEVGSINIPILKQLIRTLKIRKYLDNIKCSENIVVYSTYMPFLKAIYKLDKKYNITLIVTDLPEYYDLSNVSKLRKVVRYLNNKLIYKYLERVDQFVLLTEQMKIPLKIGDRPYIVIEGLVKNKPMTEITPNNKSRNIILYTGTLHYKFGIKKLLDAFSLINDNNYELWICGSGEAEIEVKNLAKKDKRVKFLGYVTKKEIYNLQQQATILINPRTNEGEYTKYSFPSKTMEYMVSGKPVVMYKLDGIPKEYDKYICYIEDNNVETLKRKIVEICSKSDRDRLEIGMQARKFVLNEKNNKYQASKIINMIG